MSRFSFALFSAGMMVLLLCSFARAQTHTYFSCKHEGGEASVRLTGSFVLSRSFFQASETAFGKEAVSDAIAQELRYAGGAFLRSEQENASVVVDFAEPFVVESVRSEEEPYPLSLQVDAVVHPDVKVTHPYLLAAMKRGEIKKGEPGVKISFQVKFHAMACAGGKDRLKTNFQMYLPSDPFLAYWLVPAVSRESIQWHQSRFTINPCADQELADIPDPFYYWYFWEPKAVGVSHDGKSFACQSLLKENQELTSVKAEIVSVESPKGKTVQFDRENFNRKNGIRLMAIFGVIDPRGTRMAYSDVLKLAQKKEIKDMASLLKIATFPQSDPVDPGTSNLIQFLRALDSHLATEGIRITSIPEDDILVVEGALKNTLKKVKVRIFYGETDVLTTASPQYWKSLADSLQNDDIVLYSGHSGLGENMKLENIYQSTKLTANRIFANAPAYQLVGIFSCYSYSYFGGEIAQARLKTPGRSTDLIRTASAFSDASGHVAVLNDLDPPKTSREAFVYKPWDLVLVTNYGDRHLETSTQSERFRYGMLRSGN
jgi:hypothetical protein